MNERCHGSFDKDFFFWRVYKAVTSEGCNFLRIVFCWGCDRDVTKTFKEYLFCEKGMSNRDYKNRFDGVMRRKIDTDPSGDDFDISLLYSCIKTACKCLAEEGSDVWRKEDDTKLEYVCTEIKNMRGELAHEGKVLDKNEMERVISKLENLITRGLELAGKLYARESSIVGDCIKKMKECIGHIRQAPLSHPSVEQYEKELSEMREYRKHVSQAGIDEVKENFVDVAYVDPASWFAGKDVLKVRKVFTRLDVVREKRNLLHPEAISYEDLLLLQTEDRKIPSVVLVEGEAGAGKTTLGKLMMTQWASPGDALTTIENVPATMKGLDQFDIVLHFECRNKHISSFGDLLSLLLPKVSCYLRNEDLFRAVLDLNVLVIADGLDEGNVNSERLLGEIATRIIPMSDGKLRMVLTTRPEKISKLPSLCNGLPWVHTRLTGVALNKRSEFVSRLHEEMISMKLSKQDTQGLVDFLKQSQIRIGDHYRLPLILTLLTYLWAYDPSRINAVTTSTKLYIAFHEMVQRRLVERLLRRLSEIELDVTLIEENCEKFLKVLYEISLVTVSSDSMNLSEECSEKLSQTCRTLGLPAEEMCAAFLALDRKWTAEGYKTWLAAPHKSIMEFYAAHYVYYCMFQCDDDNKFEKELQDLCIKYGKSLEDLKKFLNVSQLQKEKLSLQDCVEDLFRTSKPNKFLSDYQNVFIHFGGLLADKNPVALTELSSELVRLLGTAKVNGARWLDVVSEAECHGKVTELVAANICLQLIIRDGHTRAAIEIFHHLDERLPIRVVLDCEVRHIPHLTPMLEEIAKRDCDVELFLNHQWKDSDFGTSDNILGLITKNKCRLSHFTGNLHSIRILPDTIEKLKCTIPDNEHAKAICMDLQFLHDELCLEYLGVHVVAGIDPELLRNLPIVRPVDKECATIWLSSVTSRDVDWACRVARVLLPENCQYSSILFPRSNLSKTKCRELISNLNDLNVQVKKRGAIKVSSSTITQRDETELRFFTSDTLGCEFYSVDESSIW